METSALLSLDPEDGEGLQQAWHALHSAAQHGTISSASKCGTPSVDGHQLDYMQYCHAAAGCAPRLGGQLTASAFLRFRRGPGGTVSAAAVHEYISRRAAMLELWQHLAAFDEAGSGALTAEQLEAFIASLAMQLPGVQTLEQHLPLRLYAAVAARKLLFFHGRAGRVRIRDLVLSPVLAELLQLLAPAPAHPAVPQSGQTATRQSTANIDARHEADAYSSEAAAAVSSGSEVTLATHEDGGEDSDAEGSWFTPHTVARLVGLFQDLAGDRDFLLPDDLIRFSSGSLTELFAACVFEEHATSSSSIGSVRTSTNRQPNGTAAMSADQDPQLSATTAAPAAMDLIDFLDFLLAREHRGTPQGLRYFWPVLDLRGQGHLSKADVATWFREVRALWLERGLYGELRVADVVQEVFDLAAPGDAQRITLPDLQRCGAGGIIVGMLSDVAAFWEHDSKETLLAAEAGVAATPSAAAEQQLAQLQPA